MQGPGKLIVALAGLLAIGAAGCTSPTAMSASAAAPAPARRSLAGQYRYVLQGSVTNARGAIPKSFFESGTITSDAQGHFTGHAVQSSAAASCDLALSGTSSLAADGAYRATGEGTVAGGGAACSAGPILIAGQANADGSVIAFGTSVPLPRGGFEAYTGTAIRVH